jgi:hypothetical protein
MTVDVLNNLIGTWTIVLIPVVAGLTELIKRLLPDAIALKWTPVLSLIIAIALSMAAIGLAFPAIFTGIVIGLSASGLYSTVTNPFKVSSGGK